MTETFRKLNFKGQTPILVLGAPESFAGELSQMKGETEVHVRPTKGAAYGFVLAFAEMRSALVKAGRAVTQLLEGDAVCWFAYPKGTSKKYSSRLSRETVWDVLQPLGIRPVRQSADWSALRFRRAELVK